MRRLHTVLYMLVMVFPTIACAQEGQDPKLKQLIDALDSQVGSLDIRGRVLSTDGQPLEDVTVQYYFREFGDVLARKEIDRKSIRIDGDFRIKGENLSSANLSFSKEGFYPEKWSFVFDETTPRENPDGYERFDIEIVLRGIPTPAPLERFDGTLRTDSSGPVSVLFTQKRLLPRMAREEEEKILRDFNWPNIYIAVDTLPDESIHKAEHIPLGKRMPIDVLAKGLIRLSQPDPGDGFVVYDPGEISLRVELGFRGMLEAPVGGYVQDLVISTPESPQKVFFYCRVNGQYGKGMVSGRPAIVVEDDREVAVAGIVVYLNPTGSRDVASIHD